MDRLRYCFRTLRQSAGAGEYLWFDLLPERDSNPIGLEYSTKQARILGIRTGGVDVTPVLETFETFEKRNSVIEEIFPDYDSHHKMNIALPPDLSSRDAFNVFTLTVTDKGGVSSSARLRKDRLHGIVAATDGKLRMRRIHLYCASEKMNYFVCGTSE